MLHSLHEPVPPVNLNRTAMCRPVPQVALADAARRVSLSDEEVQAVNRRLTELQAASETERQRQSERQVVHLQVGAGREVL